MNWSTYDKPRVQDHDRIIREDLDRHDLANLLKLRRHNPNINFKFLIEYIYLHTMTQTTYMDGECLKRYGMGAVPIEPVSSDEMKLSLKETDELAQLVLDIFRAEE